VDVESNKDGMAVVAPTGIRPIPKTAKLKRLALTSKRVEK